MTLWLFAHGVIPLLTPLGGSWLNMAESIQRILIRRGLSGQNRQILEQIISWLEAIVRFCDTDPTLLEWRRARATRRIRSRMYRLVLGGSGACVCQSIRRKVN